MQVVALAIVDGDPVAVHLRDAVGAAGVKRRRFGLRDLGDLAEHLAAAGLVEADRGIDHADGVEQPRHAERSGFAGQNRLAERRLDERLRREVVDLLGLVLLERFDQRDLVEQVAVDELDVSWM